MTNADKIRSMTDGELAEFLSNTLDKCYNCSTDVPACQDCPMCEDTLNWLKMEADNNKYPGEDHKQDAVIYNLEKLTGQKWGIE